MTVLSKAVISQGIQLGMTSGYYNCWKLLTLVDFYRNRLSNLLSLTQLSTFKSLGAKNPAENDVSDIRAKSGFFGVEILLDCALSNTLNTSSLATKVYPKCHRLIRVVLLEFDKHSFSLWKN